MCFGPKKLPELPEPTEENFLTVLQEGYEQKVVPMEKRHIFDQFYNPSLTGAEFKALPIVLFLGQYSVGKTSMIKYLVGDEYPGARIGPEPTTDCFVVIHHSQTPGTSMGTSLAADSSLPFQALNIFGSAFLTRLRGASMDSPILRHAILIDTPGILSGEKQTISREYNFAKVVQFIADKVDMIVLLFDTSKLDISDEYKLVLRSLKGNEEKIKIILNKADLVEANELVRVRGALMWSLSKVIDTPEVPRVYIGSFWEKAKQKDVELYKDDYKSLFDDLKQLPMLADKRKINDVIKRARIVRTHALIMTELIKQTCLIKTEGGLKKLCSERKLVGIFEKVRAEHRLTESDMPNFRQYSERALESNLKKWEKINAKLLANLDDYLAKDIPKLLTAVPNKTVPPSLQTAYDKLLEQTGADSTPATPKA